jgi:hypothetical protein
MEPDTLLAAVAAFMTACYALNVTVLLQARSRAGVPVRRRIPYTVQHGLMTGA